MVLDPVPFPDPIGDPEGSKKPLPVAYWCIQGEGWLVLLGGAAKARADLQLLPARGRTQQRIFSVYVENGTDWSYQSKSCAVTSSVINYAVYKTLFSRQRDPGLEAEMRKACLYAGALFTNRCDGALFLQSRFCATSLLIFT